MRADLALVQSGSDLSERNTTIAAQIFDYTP
jgi:hypothetical protein